MTKVKICGVMSEKDIMYLNRHLPDYAGFVFAPGRRRLQPDMARSLAEGLAGSIARVGVFVNAEADEVAEVALNVGLGAVQIHGDEAPGYIDVLRDRLKPGTEIWKGIRVRDSASLEGLDGYGADRILLDAYVEGSYGGAGKSFDWKLAGTASGSGFYTNSSNSGVTECKNRTILAGGLNPRNVREAILSVRPFAVDVSSGVETDGCKDEQKIREFINNVRNMEVCNG